MTRTPNRTASRRLLCGICCPAILFAVVGCHTDAPSHQNWRMHFTTPAADTILAEASTAGLYSHACKPSIHKWPNPTFSRRNGTAREIDEKDGGLCHRTIGNRAISAGPKCGDVFRIRDDITGEQLGSIRTGHAYASLLGLSPCGEYVAYIVPGAFNNQGKVFIHHWRSGKRTPLDVPPQWRLDAWESVPRDE